MNVKLPTIVGILTSISMMNTISDGFEGRDVFIFQHFIFYEQFVCLFVCFVALRPKSTAMVIAGRSVHLTTLFSWAGLNKRLTSNSCTYFRL